MTKEEMGQIKARVEAATEGPWHWDEEREKLVNDFGDSVITIQIGTYALEKPHLIGYGGCHADEQFIAHAREDMPKLLAEVERLQRQWREHTAYGGYRSGSVWKG